MRRRQIGTGALAYGCGNAFAGLLDFFNGVSLGKKVNIPPLQYLERKPPTTQPLTLWYFWATWCAPCRDTIPLLNTWLTRYPELAIVAVTDEPADKVQAFVAKVPMDMPVALDTQRQLLDPLGIRGLPYAMLLDRASVVVWRGQPKDLAPEALGALLQAGSSQPVRN